MLQYVAFSIAAWVLLRFARFLNKRAKTTRLAGPPRESWIFGVSNLIQGVQDSGLVYEQWSEQYGHVYRVPTVLGNDRIELFDPKAIAHFHSHETTLYVRASFSRTLLKNFVGAGVLWAEKEDHKRQRKALSPAFSISAIRNVLPVFFDSGYKMASEA